MNAKRSPLTLTTGAASAAPAATPPARRVVNPQNGHLQRMATTWNAMSADERGSWSRFSLKAADPNKIGAVTKTNAYVSFVAANSAMISSDSPLLITAPDRPIAPVSLGKLIFSANYASSLVLTLTSVPPVSDTVLFYGAPAARQPAYLQKHAVYAAGQSSEIERPHRYFRALPEQVSGAERGLPDRHQGRDGERIGAAFHADAFDRPGRRADGRRRSVGRGQGGRGRRPVADIAAVHTGLKSRASVAKPTCVG